MELESQAECKDVLTRCKVDGRGKDCCKWWPTDNEGEVCFYYFEEIEHCGHPEAQMEALKNSTTSLLPWWNTRR
jgi:hypothetical protein